jgi:Uncharacterised protein family (UPF0175)
VRTTQAAPPTTPEVVSIPGQASPISWARRSTISALSALLSAASPAINSESGYRVGALTQSQVGRLLGFASLSETDGFLKQHGVYLEYDATALEQDTANSRLAIR